MGIVKDFVQKLNPSQPSIAQAEGDEVWSTNINTLPYSRAYEVLEVVNRGVNMIVDDLSEVSIDVGNKITVSSALIGIRAKKLHSLLNVEPNPYQDVGAFRRELTIDLLLDGNAFIYYDGAYLYHLPAANVKIIPDARTFVKAYKYENVTYNPEEIIHIKENSLSSLYRGESRLKAARRSINIIYKMQDFQDNFFANNAVPGLILKTPNTLSQKIKDRLTASWAQKYNPRSGGRRPLILDGGLEVDLLSNVNFKDLDFSSSLAEHEDRILKALGVPPILLDGGNNANIRPNHRLYYLETIVPLIGKITKGLERFFGYDLKPVTQDVIALRPEAKDQADYYSKLVAMGILSRNEVRDALRFTEHDAEFADDLVLPANIAGSAAGQSSSNDGQSSEGKPGESSD